MSKRQPAFQFYPGDFLSSSKVQRMDMAERGMYITLLCFAWQDGSIPGSMTEISRMCSLPERKAVTLWNRVSECFVQSETEPDRLVNPRMELIRSGLLAFVEAKAESGRLGGIKSAEARAKQKASTPSISLEANDQANSTSPSPSPSPSSSPSPTSEEGELRPLAISSPAVPKYSTVFEEFWKRSTRRGSKIEAFKAWGKLREDIDPIFAGMKAWQGSEQWQDESKQTHIHRWLKRRGWEEIVPKRAIAENLRGGLIERQSLEHTTHFCGNCEVKHDWPCGGLCTTGPGPRSCPEFVGRFTH